MFYIVGLGNPGEKYENTRHNVGWRVLDYLIETGGLPKSVASSKYVGKISEGVLEGEEVTLLYPDTFMNKSGSAVKKLVPKGEEDRLVVIYDDVDLGNGEIKVSVGRGSGGHNGVQSIINAIGTKNFIRVRVGVASKSFWTRKPRRPEGGAAMTKHVLSDFKKREQGELNQALETASEAIKAIIREGVELAMNKCN